MLCYGDARAPRPASAPPPSAGPDPLVLALARLDYRKTEIDRALVQVPGVEDASLEDRLRAALRVLASG